jgi:outer membrane protein OmpA-like peptidoglycan-associated protein
MDAIGYGRTRPRDAGTTEEAHQHNRRVEFVIERRQTP